jgi:predicted transcriptional regulator
VSAARRKTAAAMRARGMTYGHIAAELGVGTGTVARWLNPEIEEASRAKAREWKARHRTVCPRCGATVGYENAGEICVACKLDDRYGERNQRILAAWRAGDLARDIAEREGMATTDVLSRLSDWRRRGVYGDVPLRKRRKREAWDYVRLRWNRDGATAAEIAAELGTNGANVTQMIRAMRDAGVYVERRLPSRRVAA